jgi:hypothetical protein
MMKRFLEVAIPITVSALLAWAIWLTTSVFSGEKEQAVSKAESRALCEKVDAVKVELKELKSDIKAELQNMEMKRKEDRSEIIQMLTDIKREVKK